MQNIISCILRNNRAELNGQTVLELSPDLNPGMFADQAYKALELRYPKFFKMDTLCKLGILASELIFQSLGTTDLTNTAIYLSNKASSLETDRKHQSNIQSSEAWFPSPSVFVYTLPNIVIGEICIRHKIMGEGIFFLSEKPNFERLEALAKLAVRNSLADQVLIGWIESDGDIADAELILLKKEYFHETLHGPTD